jgi:hypothetical protein
MCVFQIEEKCSGLARENNELKSHIEEDGEEMKSLLQKNKTLVAQVMMIRLYKERRRILCFSFWRM